VLRNVDTGDILGVVKARFNGKWNFIVKRYIGAIPCSIRAESGANISEKAVQHAPKQCGF